MIIQTLASLKAKITKAWEKIGENALFFIQTRDDEKNGLVVGFKTIALRSYVVLVGSVAVAMTGSYGACHNILDIVTNKIPNFLKDNLGDSKYLTGSFVCNYMSVFLKDYFKEETEACSIELLVCSFPIEQPPWVIKLGGTLDIGKYGVLGARDENGKLKCAELEGQFIRMVKENMENKSVTEKKAIEVIRNTLNQLKEEDSAADSNEYVYQIQTFRFVEKPEPAVKKRTIKLNG